MARPYLRIAYGEAISLLQQAGYSDLVFGSDLEAEHEAKIVELVNLRAKSYGASIDRFSPVFIMRYPKEIKFLI